MKKLIALALMVTAAKVGFSQGQIFPGTVNFYTAVSPSAIIRYAPGTALGGASGLAINGTQHPTAQAALYMGAAGSTRDQLVMVTPAASFAAGAFAGFITTGNRNVPSLPQGYVGAVAQIRAWDALTSTASSYEQAILDPNAYRGESILYTLGALGGPGNGAANPPVSPANPADLPNQVGFNIAPVPEPSTIALGFLGLGGLWLLRRKR